MQQEISNIISHFIPCVYSIYLFVIEFPKNYIMSIYCVSMTVSFGTSIMYHTGQCLQCTFSDKLLIVDKMGILVLMWGSNIPIIIYGFSSDASSSLSIIFYIFFTTASVMFLAFFQILDIKYFFALIFFGCMQSLHINNIKIYEILLSTFSVYLIAFVFYSQNWHTLWHIFTSLAAFVHYHNLKALQQSE